MFNNKFSYGDVLLLDRWWGGRGPLDRCQGFVDRLDVALCISLPSHHFPERDKGSATWDS